ncbi:MAG: carboxypeptidase regulatory-like domain-containing protein [Ignavibacteriaceae bacterium]|nr:carboxypeptidase regulatory-like domain-containing protein [Ignavibacteriaceae bacterium]
MKSKNLLIVYSIALVLFLTLTSASCDELLEPQNSAPTISNVGATPSTLGQGEVAILMCVATDKEGDNLTITWTADAGTFPDGSTGTTVQWKAPNQNGSFTITATVSDGKTTTKGTVVVTVQTTNNPPTTPSNPFPANNATGVATSVTLTWTSTDPDGDALTYDVYFGTNSNPSLEVTNRTSASYSPPGISTGSTYYWKVVAKDGKGGTATSDIWRFTATSGVSNASITGIVSNATNNDPISGVTVKLQQSGSTVSTQTTGTTGAYTFSALAAGTYTLEISKTGFITDTRTVSLSQGQAMTQNFSMAPASGNVQYRIVLTWGQTPGDLDAHLYKGIYHIYYGNEGTETSAPFTILDVDDTDGYGPETITIYSLAGDSCKFYVHNYSGSPAITQSSASVKLYSGSTLLRTYNVPTTGTGYWWHVFDISPAGQVTDRNYISPTSPENNNSPLKRKEYVR